LLEAAGYSDVFLRGSEAHAASPRKPLRAGHTSVGIPAASAVKGCDHRQETAGGGVDVRGLLTQAVGQLTVGQFLEHGFDVRERV
jgi:hypothetical protein